MAAKLSERDLLLLSNLAYIVPENASGSLNTVADGLLSTIDSRKEPLRGGLSKEDARLMLQDIQNSPNLRNLRVIKYDTGTEALCLEVPGTDSAVVAYQGSGGQFARWKGNATDFADVDSDYRNSVERLARDLERQGYSDITATGHSKGGHGAEHMAVVAPNSVSRVVSFDGYGVSGEYLKQYESAIARVRGRITAINGDNDYVQGIGHDIAGRVVYVRNAGNDFTSFHRSSDLYFAGEYDNRGDFAPWCLRDTPDIVGEAATNVINNIMNDLTNAWWISEGTRSLAFERIGTVLGLVFGKEDRFTFRSAWEVTKFLLREKASGSFGIDVLTALGVVLFKNRDGIIYTMAAMSVERDDGRKPPRRQSKVPPLMLHAQGAGGLASGGQDSRTEFSPQALDQAIAALNRLQRDLEALGAQVQGSGRFASWKVSNYFLSGSVACRLRAAVTGVRAGRLSMVLGSYARMLRAYGDEVSRLARAVSEARDIFNNTERSLIEMGESLAVGSDSV
ncbi:MAG: hypothetical protein ACOX63_00700 [Christensenellales bacterium]|jgi:hypothetical protein